MLPGSDPPAEIRSFALPTDDGLFDELCASTRFEDVGKGRQGAVLVKIDEAGDVPLVRTTTRYGNPAQRFRPVHEQLAQRIQERAGLAAGFNNALIERYTDAYATMGGHCDQALDLADESCIAVFSCYSHPGTNPPRKLIVESKGSGGDRFEIPLTHHSVVVFSVDTNRRLRHKIVLDRPAKTTGNQWLGVTFRTSKTFVRFRDGHTSFRDGARLTPADEAQRREFYQLRRRENDAADFTYPPLPYTISDSDLMPPV
jgi:hypothetical protein